MVGGGPAPGINGVIASATIEAINQGLEVIGFYDGFQWLAKGDATKIEKLSIDMVSRIYAQGGSILRTSRFNPTKDSESLRNVVNTLRKLGISYLLTIGGDDTAYTASKVYDESNGTIAVVHVPKTIDNDLPLPDAMPTFGFETARHVGMLLVQNLMEDAKTTQRWYIAVTMGREAGHLTLGIGKAAGATLILIPEEFEQGVPFKKIVDTIFTAIIKRKAMGRNHGVAVVAEGIVEKLAPETFPLTSDVPRDDHGHIILSEVPFGRILKSALEKELAQIGIKTRIVEQDIGYVFRSARPLAFDIEYTRNLGYGAVKFLMQGGSGAMIAISRGKLHPLYFSEIMDPKTGRTKVRYVDIESESYEVALHYMIRLRKADLNGDLLNKMAEIANMTPEEFKRRYSYVAIS